MSRARYVVVPNESDRECLVIADVGHINGVSITNDAEWVVEHLFKEGLLHEGRRLFYYDSDGRKDEIVVRNGKFSGFAPGRPRGGG